MAKPKQLSRCLRTRGDNRSPLRGLEDDQHLIAPPAPEFIKDKDKRKEDYPVTVAVYVS